MTDLLARLPYPACTCRDPKSGHSDHCPTLRHPFNPDGSPKIAPVQGWKAGIPWSLHLEAYSAYENRWSSQAALIDLEKRGCRGGFGTKELDEFIPGWRERASEIATLNTRIESMAGDIARLREALDKMGRCLLPVHMGLMQAVCVGDPLPDQAVVLSFMGSGASDQVTAGEVREALDAAHAALTAAPGSMES
jgi:hypothetical protein